LTVSPGEGVAFGTFHIEGSHDRVHAGIDDWDDDLCQRAGKGWQVARSVVRSLTSMVRLAATAALLSPRITGKCR
jgi:hypothetical protein